METDDVTTDNLEEQIHTLFRAIEVNDRAKVHLLLKSGEDINVRDQSQNPLIHAIKHNRESIVEILLQNGADPTLMLNDFTSLMLNDFTSPIRVAASCGNLKIVKLLVEHGGSINNKCALYDHPLHFAARKGHTQIIDYFLENGADLTDPKLNGFNWLGYSNRIIEYLLEKGLDVNETNDQGQNALHSCARSLWEEKIEFLIQIGVLIDLKDYDNRTPLSTALFKSVKPNCRYAISSHKKMYISCNKMIMKYSLLSNHDQQVDIPSYYLELIQFLNDCKAEINNMQQYTIENTNITVYQFVQDIIFNPTKLIHHLYNEDVREQIKTIENYIKMFPIYSSVDSIVKSQMKKGMERKCALDEAFLAMDNNMFPKLPFEIQWKIFKFLRVSDLNNFAEAFKI